jgi:hypothetical protein
MQRDGGIVPAQKAQRAAAATGSADEATDLQQIQRRVAAADSEAPSDNAIIDLTKERVRKEALQSIAREYGNLDQMGPGALNQLQAMAPATAGPILGCTLNAPREKKNRLHEQGEV